MNALLIYLKHHAHRLQHYTRAAIVFVLTCGLAWLLGAAGHQLVPVTGHGQLHCFFLVVAGVAVTRAVLYVEDLLKDADAKARIYNATDSEGD